MFIVRIKLKINLKVLNSIGNYKGYRGKDFGLSLGTNKYTGKGGTGEFKQQTGVLGVSSGDFSMSYENDGAPFGKIRTGDNHDRYRTAAMRFQVGEFSAGFNLFTGINVGITFLNNGQVINSWGASVGIGFGNEKGSLGISAGFGSGGFSYGLNGSYNNPRAREMAAQKNQPNIDTEWVCKDCTAEEQAKASLVGYGEDQSKPLKNYEQILSEKLQKLPIGGVIDGDDLNFLGSKPVSASNLINSLERTSQTDFKIKPTFGGKIAGITSNSKLSITSDNIRIRNSVENVYKIHYSGINSKYFNHKGSNLYINNNRTYFYDKKDSKQYYYGK